MTPAPSTFGPPAWCEDHERWIGRDDPAHACCVRRAVSPLASRLASSTTGAGHVARAPSRVETGFAPLDTILGGGVVRRTSASICGDPGTGKSTLLAEALGCLAARGERSLYVSGEEARAQVDARARRVGAGWRVLATREWSDVERELVALTSGRQAPAVVVLDSLQAFGVAAEKVIAGTVTAGRIIGERAVALTRYGCAVVIVVQVVKSGQMAGPKAIEHLVDVVMDLRHGEAGARVLSVSKNRYGSAPASVALRMTPAGLVEADAARPPRRPGQAWAVVGAVGSALARVDAVVTTGRRGVEVEGLPVARARRIVEALARVIPSLAKARVSIAADPGVADDPAADLAIAAAVVSALEGVTAEGLAWAGTVSVTGDVEAPAGVEVREARARRAGARLVSGEAPGLPVGVASVGEVGEVVEVLKRSTGGASRGAHAPPVLRDARPVEGASVLCGTD